MSEQSPLILALLILATLSIGCTPEEPKWQFVEITQQAGLGEFRHTNGAEGDWYLPETFGAGGAFLDYNEDDFIDLALVGGATWTNNSVPALQLYQGFGNGTFEDMTEEMNLSSITGYGMGVIAGDIDLDGDKDLYLTTLEKNFLLINDGNGFRDGTLEAGLDSPSEWNVAATFLDANRDGWLDLYVTGYVYWTPETDLFCTRDGTQKRYCTPELYQGRPGRFYENRGDGTFVDRTKETGLAESGKTLGAITIDANRDQWPDIILANDTDPDQYFLNTGDGSFQEVGLSTGMALDSRGRARAGMGIDAGVVDSTGEPTLFIGHFEDQMNGVYRHSRLGFFEERGAASGIGPASLPALTFGMVLFDAELDGDLDLVAANGHINPQANERSDIASYRQPMQFFLNNGNGTFIEKAVDLGLSLPMVGRGALTADIDQDGDIDLLITENNGPVHLFRNDIHSNVNFLRIKLLGAAVDATIVVQVMDNKQFRRIRAGHSYASQSESTVTFGLGTRQFADTITVYWPSGSITQKSHVPANQILHLQETDP
ncbi:MAG: CRTAC1 family protein [Bacteroidetes bacterium]|nr:CRTAC1 family protein [Bacteroidota bacterium]MCY4205863.1 CRTAC1 family protein [Bacteroidota bacterium]